MKKNLNLHVTAEECVRTAESGLSEYTESESNESAISETEPAKLNNVVILNQIIC